MNNSLIETLKGLKADSTLVINLYKQLYFTTYFALVRGGTEEYWSSIEFLTYDTVDGIRELPLFTNMSFILDNLDSSALIVQIGGQDLWIKLNEIVETGSCQIAIDPGQTHGIRLTKEIILGMINSYSSSQDK